MSDRDVEEIFPSVSPDVVFHCANLAGGVDYCQANPDVAERFHLQATQRVGRFCEKTGAMLVVISSDYVFDGTGAPYSEGDAPNPLNVYGRMKLAAEEWVASNVSRHLIVRTTNIFGWDPQTVTPNYIMGLYSSLKSMKRFRAPSFLWGNPTYAEDLANALFELYLKGASGLFHVVGPSVINRLEWARKACKVLCLDQGLLDEVRGPSPTMVPRPLRSLLNADKFTSSFKTVLNDVDTALAMMKETMDE
jgi:dTDP-4-dehydrorhamnose reductase